MILFQKIESHDMRYCECISRINNYNEMGMNSSRPSSPMHSPTHRMSRMSMTSVFIYIYYYLLLSIISMIYYYLLYSLHLLKLIE